MRNNLADSSSLPWDVVERAIRDEAKWLEDTIESFPLNEGCKRCAFRDIALLILAGRVKAVDIKSPNGLWGDEDYPFRIKEHGRDWHIRMMKRVAGYFHNLGYEVDVEPNLKLGRADLGVYKGGKSPTFMEVGTVSISKLRSNLRGMEGAVILVVISENHAVEFSILMDSHREAGNKLFSKTLKRKELHFCKWCPEESVHGKHRHAG